MRSGTALALLVLPLIGLLSPALNAQISILYAPAAADDATYRSQLAAAAGPGSVVDYFDARASTPPPALLLLHDVVYTWANAPYDNAVLMGNRLAAYVDLGGNVVLGAFCTYGVAPLAGAIMGPDYCPVVSPIGDNHFTFSNYAGDGVSCVYDGVTSLDCIFRDVLLTQGGGVVDGRYLDGEICVAFQSVPPGPTAGTIAYCNGGGALALGGGGEWAETVVNAGTCISYGGQVPRDPVAPPLNAAAWRKDPLGPPSVARGQWVPVFDGNPGPGGPWTPPLGPGAVFYSGLFTGPSVPDFLVSGPQPWLLGSLLGPNPLGLQGPFPVFPAFIDVSWPIPTVPALVGQSFTTQAVAIDPLPYPLRFTNALDITIGT